MMATAGFSLLAVTAWHTGAASQRRASLLAELEQVIPTDNMVRREAVGEMAGDGLSTATIDQIGEGMADYQSAPPGKSKTKKR